MAWLIALILLAVFVGCILWWHQVPEDEVTDFDPEEIMRFRLEQHRIRRRLETNLTKSEQRRDAARLKRELAEALEDDE